MKISLRRVLLISLTIMLLTASCAPTKTLHVWKDEGDHQKLGKTLIVFVTDAAYVRNHFEDVLAERLGDSGIQAVASNRVVPGKGTKPAREEIAAKVREMGVENVVVARVVSKAEYSRLIPGGVYVTPTDNYAGWNSFYADSFALVPVSGSAYDAEYFTVVTNIYTAGSEKLIWSCLFRVRVETSLQGAVNPFIEKIIRELRSSKML